ncbi:hypothetical protein, partial [Anaerococcus hydrogenalis]|uniref:hypothetical protein n=1 Tax=Anaerococcus hydrogenalis TaxID=33029 RepID=UPI001D3EC364
KVKKPENNKGIIPGTQATKVKKPENNKGIIPGNKISEGNRPEKTIENKNQNTKPLTNSNPKMGVENNLIEVFSILGLSSALHFIKRKIK